MSKRKPYSSKKHLIILAILVILLATFGGVYYYLRIKQVEYEKIQQETTNMPASKVPESKIQPSTEPNVVTNAIQPVPTKSPVLEEQDPTDNQKPGVVNIDLENLNDLQPSNQKITLYGPNDDSEVDDESPKIPFPKQQKPATITDFIRSLERMIRIHSFDHPMLNVINQYISQGFSIDSHDDRSGFTPLSFALSFWMAPVLKRMHELSGINVHKRNSEGYTIMHSVVASKPKSSFERYQLK